MSEPKEGQRLRVTFEGMAVKHCSLRSRRDFHVAVDGTDFCVPMSATVEVLRPPVKVGDVIETAEQLDALPEGTIALGPDGDAWRVTKLLISNARLWRSTSGHQPLVGPATVLYLPDGAA